MAEYESAAPLLQSVSAVFYAPNFMYKTDQIFAFGTRCGFMVISLTIREILKVFRGPLVPPPAGLFYFPRQYFNSYAGRIILSLLLNTFTFGWIVS